MKHLTILLTTLAALAFCPIASAYCVQNQTGQTLKVNRTNCNLPGDRPAFGCDYQVKSKSCEQGQVSSKHPTSHLWVFNKERKLLCSVNIKNHGETLIVKNSASGKNNCQIASR